MEEDAKGENGVVEQSSSVTDIWQLVLEQRRKDEATEKKNQAPEATILFCGARQAGKSTLIQTYMFKDKEPPDDLKPTTALDYKYTRSSVGMSMEKDLTHFWELGGGRSMAPLLEFAVTPENIAFALIILTIDLSKPSRAVKNLSFWLGLLRARIKFCVSKISAQNLKAMQAVETDTIEASHPDRNVVDPIPIPCLIVGAKYDLFKDSEPELQRVACRTLRAIAHQNGCSLLFTSKKSKTLLQAFRSRIHRHVYNRHGGSKTIQLDHTKPLSVPAGSDSFADLGMPERATKGTGAVLAWTQHFEQIFPANSRDDEEAGVSAASDQQALNPEPLVDSMLTMREEDFRRVKAEMALKRKMKQADNEFKLANDAKIED